MQKQSATYIITNHRHGILYVGVTGNLQQRIFTHREGQQSGFAKKYGLKMLVWYELHGDMNAAIMAEKQIKTWKRGQKIELIEKMNPCWDDLYEQLVR